MNHTLEKTIFQADGRYFTDSELQALESYAQTYTLRLQTYSLLCERSDEFVLRSLRQLAITDGDTILRYGDICKRDMGYVLRVMALAILRDDAEGFRQELILWMQNIMSALNKTAQSVKAYRLLQDVVRRNAPAENAKLINNYLEEFILALSAGL